MVKHPSLFQINTRVLVNTFSTGKKRATLSSIPNSYWKELASQGMDWVWLMGVWQLKEKSVNENLIPESMMDEFRDILPDLTEDDIDGSTYAIEDYIVDPVIGGKKELLAVRKKLNKLGIRLMLDYIPNHFGAHTHWLKTFPEYFIEVSEEAQKIDSTTFYSPKTLTNKYYAHGKDPYFDAWQDTVQVDYSFEGTREWMTERLMGIAELCDGVRCDMAMLPVKRIFQKTWGAYVNWNGEEFWPQAIETVKATFPDFTMLAEVYWDMEAELLDFGFDYCYDKTFYDRLVDPPSLRAHFNADTWYLEKTARFLENHDEPRAASKLGLKTHMAAAALVALGPGMRFWHMGQWDGKVTRLPVQINRAPEEYCACMLSPDEKDFCQCLRTFYANLNQLVNSEIFKSGHWEQVSSNNELPEGAFVWRWTMDAESVMVAINFSDQFISLESSELEVPIDFDHQIALGKVSGPKGSLRPWDIRLYQG